MSQNSPPLTPQCHQVLCSHCRKHLWPSLRLWHHLKALLLQNFNKYQACYFCLLIIDISHPRHPSPHLPLFVSHTDTHTGWNVLFFKKNIYCFYYFPARQTIVPRVRLSSPSLALPSSVIYCASCALRSTRPSKITFVVWFRLFTLPEMQFPLSMSAPIMERETLKNPCLPIHHLRPISSPVSFKEWTWTNLTHIKYV